MRVGDGVGQVQGVPTATAGWKKQCQPNWPCGVMFVAAQLYPMPAGAGWAPAVKGFVMLAPLGPIAPPGAGDMPGIVGAPVPVPVPGTEGTVGIDGIFGMPGGENCARVMFCAEAEPAQLSNRAQASALVKDRRILSSPF